MARKLFYCLFIVLGSAIFPGCQRAAQTQTTASALPGRLAFTCLTEGFWQIWVGPAGGEVKQLTHTPIDKKRPRWSNRGDQLVYQTNNGEIFVMNADGSNERQVAADIGIAVDPVWAADERSLFLSVFRSQQREDSEIWQIPLVDGTPQRWTSEVGLQYNPAPSPDGKWLVYTSGAGETTHELWRLGLDGSAPTRLTENRAFDILPRWSADGKTIAFASNREGSYDVWRMDSGGGNVLRLTDHPGLDTGPAWSPDGQWLTFESDRAGQVQIWVLPAGGGEARRVSPAELMCRNVDWGSR